MSLAVTLYELSPAADRDIDEIFDYTEDEFGIAQAIIYVGELGELFTALVDNPELGRERLEIRAGLRSVAQGSHVVFYRILKDKIRVVRVPHGSRDLPKSFNLKD